MGRFAEELNRQVGSEFAASQQYVAIAVHYDAQTLPALAAHFYRQAVEERNHAMMIVQYLLDADAEVVIPAAAAPRVTFGDDREPVALALEQERNVTAQIANLVKVAREEGDAVGPLFFHGQGAGQMPTASAVVADMIDMAVGRTAITFRTLELWSNRKARVTAAPNDAARAKFYLRVMVQDHPGVLAQVTAALGAHYISIASVLQHPAEGLAA